VTLGWYDPRFFDAIGRYARDSGWHLATRSMLEAADPSGWVGDGMLVNDTEVPRLAGFIRSQIAKQPTVLFGANHQDVDAASVEEDNLGAGRLAAEHFLERGYRHFAWIGIPRGRVERDRREGFVSVLEEAGQDCALLNLDAPSGHPANVGKARRKRLAMEIKALPKQLAVFALDDLLAAEVIEACLDVGLRVPEDVAVLGAGNIELACECSPVPISSIDLNFGEIAYRAAGLLDGLMKGKARPAKPITIPLRGIVMRRSTDALAVSHPGIEKAVRFISENHTRNIGVEDISAAAKMSSRALHYAFSKELRRTPAKHLLYVRLDAAKNALENPAMKIEQVAQDCGFGSSRNLHRCFVREIGTSPQKWREVNSGDS
jgi:LacI family transcriptional regulator